MDVRPDEGMEGGVFAPYGGKYEGSGRDRGLTPFPRTSEEQGSKIQKRGAESTEEGSPELPEKSGDEGQTA